MAKSNFKPTDFNQGKTYNDRTKAFVGVDLTDPQVQVANYRGVYSRNYFYKQTGKVETRFAYEEVAERQVGTGDRFNHETLLGVWKFTASDGYEHKVAAIFKRRAVLNMSDKLLFKEWEMTDKQLVFGATIETVYVSGWVRSVQAIASEGRLWFVTGLKFLVCYYDSAEHELVVKPVSEWEGTHIPTVTYLGVAENVDTTNVPSTTFVTLEYPNALSKYRTDLFLAGLGVDTGNAIFQRFTLEGGNNVVPIKGTFGFRNSQNHPDEYDVLPIALTEDVYNSDTALDPDYHSSAALEQLVDLGKDGSYLLVHADEMPATVTEPIGLEDGSGGVYIKDTDCRVFGVVNITDGEAKLYLADDFPSGYSGKPNISITYQYISDSDFAKQVAVVDKCSIATLFGKNNSLNRLWLAGNPDQPNYAYHTAQPYKTDATGTESTDGDYSYIPLDSYIKFGSPMNAIVAMEVVTSDKMMVLKNKAGTERTMYFVTPIDVTRTVVSAEENVLGTGDITIAQEEYSTSLSNTSSAALSCAKPSCNFNGDVLFISDEKQVVGLDVVGITGDSQRVASTRSHYIDRALIEEIDQNSAVYALGNYLFLFGKNSLYVSHVSSFTEDGKQYEWWPCDLPDKESVRLVTEIEGNVLIVTNQSIYRLNNMASVNKPVADIDKVFFDIGNMAFGADEDYLTTSTDYGALLPELPSGAELYKPFPFDYADVSSFYYEEEDGNPLYYFIADVGLGGAVESNDAGTVFFTSDPTTMALIKDGMTAHLILDGFSEVDRTLAVLTDEEAETLSPGIHETLGYGGIYFRFGTALSVLSIMAEVPQGAYAFSEEADSSSHVYLGLKTGNSEITLVSLSPNESNLAFSGFFEVAKTIVPVFMTLRLADGQIGFDKHIDNVTIWNDSANPCELYVGVISNKEGATREISGIFDPGVGFDLNSVSFENTSFDRNAVVEFYNLKKIVRQRQSFTLCFTAKSKRNSVLSGLDISYRVKKARHKR